MPDDWTLKQGSGHVSCEAFNLLSAIIIGKIVDNSFEIFLYYYTHTHSPCNLDSYTIFSHDYQRNLSLHISFILICNEINVLNLIRHSIELEIKHHLVSSWRKDETCIWWHLVLIQHFSRVNFFDIVFFERGFSFIILLEGFSPLRHDTIIMYRSSDLYVTVIVWSYDLN